MFIDNNIIPNNLVTFVQGCILCAAANSSLPKARQLCLLSKTNNRTQVKITNTYSKQTVPAKPKTTQSVKHVELFQSHCLLLYGNFKGTFAIVFEIPTSNCRQNHYTLTLGQKSCCVTTNTSGLYSNSIKSCSVKENLEFASVMGP